MRRRANELNERLKGDQIPLYSPAIEPQSGSLRQPKAEAEGLKRNAEEASDTEATDDDQKFRQAFDPSICGVAPSSTNRSGGRIADCPSRRSQARPCEARKDIAGTGLARNRHGLSPHFGIYSPADLAHPWRGLFLSGSKFLITNSSIE